jgi:hypothetical protein
MFQVVVLFLCAVKCTVLIQILRLFLEGSCEAKRCMAALYEGDR